jgi:hypothetical protein
LAEAGSLVLAEQLRDILLGAQHLFNPQAWPPAVEQLIHRPVQGVIDHHCKGVLIRPAQGVEEVAHHHLGIKLPAQALVAVEQPCPH